MEPEGMPLINIICETDELNLFVEDFLRIKSQPDVVPCASRQVGDNSSSITDQKSGVGGESSSLENYISTFLNLPPYFKSCLGCCSFVTEKYSVEKEKLVWLLVAEGLIVQDNSGNLLEDIALSVIEELISLGMLLQDPVFHKVTVDPSYQQLCEEITDTKDFVSKAEHSRLRLCILDDGRDDLPPNLKTLPLKSLFVVTAERQGLCGFLEGRLSRAYIEVICKLKSLVVLDLNGVIECLPDEVGDLVHLRYLGLFYSHLKELPRTIGKLQNLQTLDARFCRFNELTTGVLDIQQLRHLILSNSMNHCEVRVPKKIGEMKNLQTLCGIYAGDGIANELRKLTHLRKLEVMRIAEDHASDLSEAIMKMPNLVSLALGVEISCFPDRVERSVFPELETFSPPPLIQDVTLSGQLVEMPNWLLSLQDLTKLYLHFSYLRHDVTSEIQYLPKLKHLTLWDASEAKCIGKEFCVAGGFPKLETLAITSRCLVEWTEIAKGAFPSLRSLKLTNCTKFKFFPNGLQNIPTLEVLFMFIHQEDLRRRLEGEENYKIKNIPKVIFL